MPLPPRRCTISFVYPEEEPGKQEWWLVVDGGKVDLCLSDPGYEVDVIVKGSLRSMTAIWMGHATLKAEVDAGRLDVAGDRLIARSMQSWLGLSPFAKEPRKAA